MSSIDHDTVRAVAWRDGALELIDQRALPQRLETLRLTTCTEVRQAIADMAVRGAPAIGIAAAYGVVLAARARYARSRLHWRRDIEADLYNLKQARPTAVNLAWAVEAMRAPIPHVEGDPEPVLLEAAQRIHRDDVRANRTMGRLGADLLAPGSGVLTHCNTGSLATGGYGTALGVIRTAYAEGKVAAVYAGETRPWLQGSRLTAWELARDGLPVRLIADGAAAALMRAGAVDWVIVGADRIAANGDVANKIGTYGLAVAARHHGIGFMVVAPSSTLDMAVASGEAVPIETRPADEVLSAAGVRVAPAEGVDAWNPVFDVTPADLIDAIVTERGVVRRPDAAKMTRLMAGPECRGA
ncbi:MAG: S-methyl-5-thioribose-1-phosphate isomerase [Gammaproteobacteria bacterium]|nr:S-methyl-5-thioribose-1-phosphate isomerase [Gammaproteobacteria bacterium]